MRGIRYMKIYEIIDEENAMSAGVLLYYEKEKTCIAELPEYLDEWTAPFLFSVYVKKHIFTIPRDISFLWVKERVIPSGRQNIDAILKNHHMKSYDEMKFLEISEGRCSQDSLYIRKIDRLPDYVVERQKHNLVECVPMDEHALLCFFADQTVRKMELAKLTGVEDVKKILKHEAVYQSAKIGAGGYYVTFNDSIDIPAGTLYEAGVVIPLKLKDFKAFVRKNVLDTTESSNLLECTRQNISYLVNQQQLEPIKEEVRGNLYLKGEVLSTKW